MLYRQNKERVNAKSAYGDLRKMKEWTIGNLLGQHCSDSLHYGIAPIDIIQLTFKTTHLMSSESTTSWYILSNSKVT